MWDKLVPHLDGAKTVLISPDGPLTGLPFAALPGQKPGSYLVEDGYAFATVPVPQLLPALLAPPAKPAEVAPSLLAVGDVDYGPAGPYRRLAGTGPEAESVRGSFAGAFPGRPAAALTAGRATKAAFAEQAPRHRFLHVATHGYFADESVVSALDPGNRSGPDRMVLDRAVTGLHPGLRSLFAEAHRAGATTSVDPNWDATSHWDGGLRAVLPHTDVFLPNVA